MKLLLKHFRSHKKLELDLNQITVIVGPNGSGKTNILEAISFISAARSFRSDDKRTLIKDGADFCQIRLAELEVIISKVPRLMAAFKVNDVPKRIYDFVGLLPTVVFTPESLTIVTGSPSERRRFMDLLLSQVSRDYLKALIEYKKVLHRRNHLLACVADGESQENELDFWDEKLSQSGDTIIKQREELISYFAEELARVYKEIDPKKEELIVSYHCQSGGPVLEKLKSRRATELAARTTIFGPHRDDLKFFLNGHDASNYASRGELRSIVMALKLAELKFIAKMKESDSDNEHSPILLLDDIFSELDEHHREHIYNLIKHQRTVLTTTEVGNLSKELVKEATIIEIS